MTTPAPVAALPEARNVVESPSDGSDNAEPETHPVTARSETGLNRNDLNRAFGFLLALLLSSFGWWLSRVDSRVSTIQSAQASTDQDVARLDGEVRAELRGIHAQLDSMERGLGQRLSGIETAVRAAR